MMASGERGFNDVLQPKRTSELNGAIPTVWDDGWQFYTDLTKEQIAAFQAMPEWQSYLSRYASWEQSKVGDAPSLTVTAIKTLQSAVSKV